MTVQLDPNHRLWFIHVVLSMGLNLHHPITMVGLPPSPVLVLVPIKVVIICNLTLMELPLPIWEQEVLHLHLNLHQCLHLVPATVLAPPLSLTL